MVDVPYQVPLIGVGGVGTGQQAYDKIRAGASLVQVKLKIGTNYTGLGVLGKKRPIVLFRGHAVVQRGSALLSLVPRQNYCAVRYVSIYMCSEERHALSTAT